MLLARLPAVLHPLDALVSRHLLLLLWRSTAWLSCLLCGGMLHSCCRRRDVSHSCCWGRMLLLLLLLPCLLLRGVLLLIWRLRHWLHAPHGQLLLLHQGGCSCRCVSCRHSAWQLGLLL